MNGLQLRLLRRQDRRQAGLQPVDLLRLLLNVNDQLVAVLLLDLLVAKLFGHSAGLLQAGSLVLSEFFQSIGKVENVSESGTLHKTFEEDWQLADEGSC